MHEKRDKLTVEIVDTPNGPELAIDRENGGRVKLSLKEVPHLLQDLVRQSTKALSEAAPDD